MSDETQHTGAPWHWGDDWPEVNGSADGIGGDFPKYADLQLYGADGEVILPVRVDHYSVVWDQYPIELSEADRRLIVAAPDYDKACRKPRDTQHGTDLTAPELLRLAGGRVKGDIAGACYDLARDLEDAIRKAAP